MSAPTRDPVGELVEAAAAVIASQPFPLTATEQRLESALAAVRAIRWVPAVVNKYECESDAEKLDALAAKLAEVRRELAETSADVEYQRTQRERAQDLLTEAENIARLNGAGRDRALAQLEEARRDGERLTWLDENGGEIKHWSGTWEYVEEGDTSRTLRQAIDAARAKKSSDNGK